MALSDLVERKGLSDLSSSIQPAIQRGAQRYFDACQMRIPGFVAQHFSYPGALDTNRVAFGLDILRAPVNLFWAPCFTLISLLAYLLGRFTREDKLRASLASVPAGLTTEVQQHISDLVMRDLLQAQYSRAEDLQLSPSLDEKTVSDQSLSWYITEELRNLYQEVEHQAVDIQQFHRCFEPIITESLSQYQVTRTALADIANTLSCTVFGAFAFQKFTPGGIGIALMLAYSLNRQFAASDFIFGSSLGAWYYGFFPPDPSCLLTAGSIVFVLTLLASCAALSGVITDPIQAKLGLHRYRLHKMLKHMERDLIAETQGSFRPKDQYVARIMDSFDMIKSGLL